MKEPAQLALDTEDHPRLPPGPGERVSGYGVMGLTFASGHILGLRRWTASSVGEDFTSVWHRDPAGRWTFYESAPCDVACTRYFGADVERACLEPIRLDWFDDRRLHVQVADSTVDWTIDIGSNSVSRAMSAIGSVLPRTVWRSRPVLSLMGRAAGVALGVGRVQLTGATSNGQRFEANPLKVWYVTDSQATVGGQALGPVGALPKQARMADFYFPQRGIFAVGRVFVTPLSDGRRNSSETSAIEPVS